MKPVLSLWDVRRANELVIQFHSWGFVIEHLFSEFHFNRYLMGLTYFWVIERRS